MVLAQLILIVLIMKQFEVKALGHEEISSQENVSLSGGTIWGWIIPVIIEGVIEYLLDKDGSIENFNTGYNTVSNWLNS